MAKPTRIEVFGAGSTEDIDFLHIAKTDLVAVGLTPSATNTAEALLTAIILLAKSYLTPEGINTNLDQSISLEDGFETLLTRGSNTARQKTLNINLYKNEPVVAIDPDDY